MFQADRLKRLRKEAGFIQADMAEKLNIKRETYTRYETGSINPPSDMILAISKLFDVSADYLLGNTNDPTPPDNRNSHADREIITIQRLRENLSAKDKEKMMQLLRITFDEAFPKEEEEVDNGVQEQES